MLYLIVLALMMASSVRALNLIQNGNFETGALAPQWATPLGNSFLQVVPNFGQCHGGKFCCAFGSIGSDNSIVQSVLAVDGTTYTLSFWLFSTGAIPNDFSVTAQFDGGLPTTQFSITNVGPSSPFFFFSTIIQSPPGPTTTHVGLKITFAGRNDQGFLYLDDIVLDGISGVHGDPQFVGLRGQSYQVHGVDGQVYNLVSSANTQINSRFVFLNHGKCPIIHGVQSKNCWSHPGSYLGSIGIQQIVNGTNHQLVIHSGSFEKGFSSIELNGLKVKLGSVFEDGSHFSLLYNSTHRISVQTEEFLFIFENSDMFINQAATSCVPLSTITAHGLFGQTHQRKLYKNALKYIEGSVDEYVISENNLFGSSFIFNKFKL